MEEKPLTSLSNGQQQFNLRWNNHTNNILQVFIEQLASETLVDVTLSCEGQFIKAHKMILSACSTYFQDLFKVHTVPHPLIIINGMKYNDVKQVIDFMYRGEVKVLEADLDSLLAVAESLQVKGLCSVRSNYDKNELGKNSEQSTEVITPEQTNSIRTSKRRKLSSNEEICKQENLSDNESLSGTIKIEPPEIKDIDQEEEIKHHNETMEQQVTPKSIKSKSRSLVRRKEFVAVETKPRKIAQKSQNTAINEPVNKSCKIPRPPNAFMIFANEWRRKLASEYPKESNKEISIRLGVMWKSLSYEKKENYYSASRKADEEHKRKYPGYYYSPKEARIRKNMKDSLISNKTKKNCDAMRFVKLVMKDNKEDDRWRQSEEREDDSFEEDLVDDVTLNVETDTDTDNLKIVSSPEESEENSNQNN